MSDNGASRVPPVDETPAAESAEPITAVSLAWLPAGDYERALDLWPDFAGSDLVTGPDGPVAHPLYCRRMQQKLVEFAEAGFPGLAVAAIRVATLRCLVRRTGSGAGLAGGPRRVCRVPDSTR